MKITKIVHSRLYLILGAALFLILGIALFIVSLPVAAQPSPLHPNFPLLDEAGENVLDTDNSISTMETCGACHDTEFIAEHSFHADAGLNAADDESGYFSTWNPLTYRYLSSEGDERIDMTTPEWIQVFGARHVGGGPAVYGTNGQLLTDLPVDLNDPQTTIIDPETGELIAWDWQESGVVEMNCFLCHIPEPNNDARIGALEAGNFGLANTATLLGTGIVDEGDEGWIWNETAFDDEGYLNAEVVAIQDPSNENCGQCHGVVHVEDQEPLNISSCDSDEWNTYTTGQIYSSQRLSSTGVNLAGKEDLSRSYDVHAERVLSCTDCHSSANNPIYYEETDESQPDHLTFDPRRIDFGEYLYRPLHDFTTDESAARRTCESCHDAEVAHEWLPYQDRHTSALACETCHVPTLYAPARQSVDWTVIQSDNTPQTECRGVDENSNNELITGYEPVLLPVENPDGTTTLAPHNIITTWFWVYDDEELPVPLRDLEAVWLDGDDYQADILDLFDTDDNGVLSDDELLIDSDEKEALIVSRLEAQGLDNPRIAGEVQSYSINHNVTHSEWAIRECATCHSDESRINQPILLADASPGGVSPEFSNTSSALFDGELYTSDAGELYYQPLNTIEGTSSSLYILGHDSVYWIDLFGALSLVGVTIGVVGHGGLRYFSARKQSKQHDADADEVHHAELQEVYMYSVYERLWHWLQTLVIMILIFTGMIIHKPDKFGMFSFNYMVEVHNIMAVILFVNAALAAFYHMASGEIRQFLPQPRGFFNQAIEQSMFYLKGIFSGEEHPFEKTAQKKMNPLQQVTYLGILNVLLPLQIITGTLIWGAQQWPAVDASLGGLAFLAPFHTLIAWLFASFIVMHVYLTTTGHTPLAGIKGMMMGWDEVEVHDHSTSEESKENEE